MTMGQAGGEESSAGDLAAKPNGQSIDGDQQASQPKVRTAPLGKSRDPRERNLALEVIMEERAERRSRSSFFIGFLCFNMMLYFFAMVVYGEDGMLFQLGRSLGSSGSSDGSGSTGLLFISAICLAIAVSFVVAKVWDLMVTEGSEMWVRALGRVVCVVLYFLPLSIVSGGLAEAISWFFTLLIPALLYWLAFRRIA